MSDAQYRPPFSGQQVWLGQASGDPGTLYIGTTEEQALSWVRKQEVAYYKDTRVWKATLDQVKPLEVFTPEKMYFRETGEGNE